MRAHRLISCIALALALTTSSGCGEQRLSRDDQKVADSLAAYAISQSDGVWNKKEAQCMAEVFVESAGVDALKEAGLVSESGRAVAAKVTMTRPIATRFADSVLGCVDFADLTARQIANLRPDIDTASFAACVRKQVSAKEARSRLIAQQMNDLKDATYLRTNAEMLKCAEQANP